MKFLVVLTFVLSTCLGLVFQAAADEIWTVYADSTLAGQFGYLVTFADEDNTGATVFLSTEEGHRRFVANREFGTDFWVSIENRVKILDDGILSEEQIPRIY